MRWSPYYRLWPRYYGQIANQRTGQYRRRAARQRPGQKSLLHADLHRTFSETASVTMVAALIPALARNLAKVSIPVASIALATSMTVVLVDMVMYDRYLYLR